MRRAESEEGVLRAGDGGWEGGRGVAVGWAGRGEGGGAGVDCFGRCAGWDLRCTDGKCQAGIFGRCEFKGWGY